MGREGVTVDSMSASRAPLPDFTAPPVVEVVLGVQFDPLTALRAAHVGLLWEEFRPRFPRVEDKPPLTPAPELFGISPGHIDVQFELVDAPPLPRSWFLNSEGTELIQFQQDRLVHNWRKVGDADYPRYWSVRDSFRQEVETLRAFLEREKLGPFLPSQCEVTYVNHLLAGSGWDEPGQLERVFTLWAPRYSDDFLPEAEQVRVGAQYVISDDAGEPLGRLHVSIVPARRTEDNQSLLQLTLSARGRPDGDGLDGVFRFLDRGHEWAVRGFASVTPHEMHKIWGRRDGH
jgi:uncharacterized protein (TIGR04255 family)